MTIDSYRAGDPAGTELMMRYDANKKSVLLAYLIWFFLGLFGVHRFYLGRVSRACACWRCTAFPGSSPSSS